MSAVEKPKRKPGTKCPLWKKDVSKVCHECELYMQVEAVNPQTGERMSDEWGCAIVWGTWATIRACKDIRDGSDGIQKATESFRNNTSRQMNEFVATLARTADALRENAQPRLNGPDAYIIPGPDGA